MWTQTRTWPSSRAAEIASSKSWASSGSIVKVGSSREVHARVGRVRARPAASLGLGLGRARVASGAGRGRASGPRARRAPRRGARAGGSRARRACPSRPARGRPRRRRRARPRCAGRWPNSGSATRKRPRFSSTATSGWSRRRAGRPRTAALTACSGEHVRAPSAAPRRAWCRGLSTAFTCGLDALLGDRLAAREVVVGHGEVEVRRRWRAARPPAPGPCRRCCVPTTVARLRSRSAPVTISEALALPPSTSTTTGMSSGRSRRPRRPRRAPRACARVRTRSRRPR